MPLEPCPAVQLTKSEWTDMVRVEIEAAWQKRPFERVEDIFALADLCRTAKRLPLADLSEFKSSLPFPAQKFSWLTRLAECDPLREVDPLCLPLSIETLYMIANLDDHDRNDFFKAGFSAEPSRRSAAGRGLRIKRNPERKLQGGTIKWVKKLGQGVPFYKRKLRADPF